MDRSISIIIPSYNGLALLEKCLPPVLDEARSYAGDTEVVVVDDGSTDGTAAFLAQAFPAVRIVRSETNRGFSCSMNAGVAQARFDLVLMLNNDVEIACPLLASLAGLFIDPGLFAAQPKMISGNADEARDVIGEFIEQPGFLKYRYAVVKQRPAGPVATAFVSGGCALFDRNKFTALGMFDGRFSPVYFEDLDLCRRAGLFGWRMLYHPGVTVFHRHPASTVDAKYGKWRKNLIHKRNYFRFLLKHALFFRVPCLAPLRIFLYSCAKSAQGNRAFLAGLFLALMQRSTPCNENRGRNNRIMYLDTPIPPPGGGQKSLMVILANLTAFQPFVVTDIPSELDRHARETGIPFVIHPVSKAGALFALVKCGALIRMIDPALIHCNSAATFYTFLFALAARLCGVPFIWHVRVIGSAGWKDAVIAALSTRVIVISDAVGGKFRRYGTSGKIIKVHNAADTGVFRPGLPTAPLRGELKLPSQATVVGIFSRLDGWKGHKLLFEAAALLAARSPTTPVRYLVVGDGPDKEDIISACGARGQSGAFIFTGLRDDIAALMNLCDIIVNPSIQPEPFGRTVIEAMACARTVIATNMGGHKEIIHHGRDGFLVAPEARAFADAIGMAAGDPALRERIGAQARETVLAEFSVGRQMERIEQLYRETAHDLITPGTLRRA